MDNITNNKKDKPFVFSHKNNFSNNPLYSAPVNQKDSPGVRTSKDLLSGIFGGMGMCLSGHPLDTIKVRLIQSPTEYAGTIDCAKKTIKGEGFLGLYKGVQSPLVGMAAMNGSLFLLFGNSTSYCKSYFKTDQLSVTQTAIAGGIAGFGVAAVESPVDLFKSHLQIDTTGKFKGLADVAKYIYSNYSIRGVYQGYSGTLLRNTTGNAIYFGSYELARRTIKSENESLDNLPFWKTFLAGGLGGQAFWTLCYPLDMIKTTLQTDSINPAKRKYTSLIHAITGIYKSAGIRGFFAGFIPCALRAFPSNATQFLIFETVRGFLGRNN